MCPHYENHSAFGHKGASGGHDAPTVSCVAPQSWRDNTLRWWAVTTGDRYVYVGPDKATARYLLHHVTERGEHAALRPATADEIARGLP